MHTVIVDGQDLNYLRQIVTSAVSGELGGIMAVQIYVEDSGQIILGTNGVSSRAFGTPIAPLQVTDEGQFTTDSSVAAHRAEQEHVATQRVYREPPTSGNPYANVPQEDTSETARLQARVETLESFARAAAQYLPYDVSSRFTFQQ